MNTFNRASPNNSSLFFFAKKLKERRKTVVKKKTIPKILKAYRAELKKNTHTQLKCARRVKIRNKRLQFLRKKSIFPTNDCNAKFIVSSLILIVTVIIVQLKTYWMVIVCYCVLFLHRLRLILSQKRWDCKGHVERASATTNKQNRKMNLEKKNKKKLAILQL